jgi:hypothetical protein
MTALLAERLPLGQPALGALLVREGLATAPLTLSQLMRLYRRQAGGSPVAIVHCAGTAIAVASETYRTATVVGAVALLMVRSFGLSSATAVAARARMLSSPSSRAALTNAFVRRVLDAVPRTCWLDGARQDWFAFRGLAPPLEQALRKVFAVSPRVRLAPLRSALAKALPPLRGLPAAAVRRYLVEVGGCAVQGVFARRPGAPSSRSLTSAESALVKLFEAAGRTLDLRAFRLRAEGAGVPRTTVNRLLELSPLFVCSDAGRVTLIGDRRVARYA